MTRIQKSWIDNKEPIPFTQDFGELTLLHTITEVFGGLRYYGGIAYATLVRPTDVQRFSYFAGFEVTFDKIFGSVFQQPTNVYCSYHISLTGIPTYSSSHQFQCGIKFGKWLEKGTTIYLAYYTGRHIFAEYFDKRLSIMGVGFTVDFF